MRAAWLLVLLLPLLADAQPARRYAVLSLLGDGLTLASREGGVGRGSEKAGRQFVPLEDPALDNAAVLAVDDALQKLGSSAVMLGVRDPAIYKAQADVLESETGIESLLPLLHPVLANAEATHLILLTKTRYEAVLRLRDGSTGAGKLEGLGFYLDRDKRLRNTQTRVASQGYVAPYAYFEVALVDLRSGHVLGRSRQLQSTIVTKPDADDPWEALTPEEKVRALRSLIRRGVQEALPHVLKSPG
jgi:hypothetical protein